MASPGTHLDKSFASAALASCHIWALYETNELDGVESLCGQYHDDIAGSVILDFMAIALVSLARTHDVRGRPDQALEILDEMERIGNDSNWTRLISIVDWERVRRALAAGDIERAKVIAAHVPSRASSTRRNGLRCRGSRRGIAGRTGSRSTPVTWLAALPPRRRAGAVNPRTYRREAAPARGVAATGEGSHNAAHRSSQGAAVRSGGAMCAASSTRARASCGCCGGVPGHLPQRARRGVRDEHRGFIEQLLAASGQT
jgi:LuxR family maltose regulon positive regulatory protein